MPPDKTHLAEYYEKRLAKVCPILYTHCTGISEISERRRKRILLLNRCRIDIDNAFLHNTKWWKVIVALKCHKEFELMNQNISDREGVCCGLPPFEHRDLRWFFIYYALYAFTYVSYIFAGVVRAEDLLDGRVSAEYLLNGRPMIWLMRHLTGGEAVNYPISGIVAGLFLAAAVLLVVKWLRVHDSLSRALCGAMFFSIPQWAGVLFYQKMADAMALGIFLSLLSAILITFRGRRFVAISVLCCTSALSCYQTLGLVFGVAVLVALLASLRYKIPGFGYHYICKAAFTTLLSCTLYFCVSSAIKASLPADCLRATASYQGSIVGWGNCSGWEQICSSIWKFGICHPVKTMCFSNGKVYVLAIIAMMVFCGRAFASCGFRRTCLLGFMSMVMLCLPYATGLLLLSPVGMFPRVLDAVPVALLCAVALILRDGAMNVPVMRKCLPLLCALLFLRNAYAVSSMAKNESYAIQTSVAELRDMSIMGRIAAQNTAAQDGRILLCGYLPDDYYEDPRVADSRPSHWHSSCACPTMFRWDYVMRNFMVKSYARAERLPRLVVATPEEAAKYAATLQTMPIWPADGSVRVDGDVVLIKIWDLIDEPVSYLKN